MTKTKDIIWRELAISVPSEWEILQFSKKEENGFVAFADRYQFRLELRWNQLPKKPNLEHMIQDNLARIRKKSTLTGDRLVNYKNWQGFQATINQELRTHLVYWTDDQRLIETTFIWPDKVDKGLIKKLTNSFRTVDEEHQHWKAFGLDINTQKDLFLDSCKIQPGSAKFLFQDKKQLQLEIYERIGLLDQWLKKPVNEWLKLQEPNGVNNQIYKETAIGNHRVFSVRGFISAMSFPKWSKKKNRYWADAWICPEDKRLYHVSRIFSAKEKVKDELLFGQYLRCCETASVKGTI
ncbi:MAG: hypothetical protein MK193_01470 [Lentisphaeria bacterium]|nr:hypothetical protein [Lentisphaeria bacterium]